MDEIQQRVQEALELAEQGNLSTNNTVAILRAVNDFLAVMKANAEAAEANKLQQAEAVKALRIQRVVAALSYSELEAMIKLLAEWVPGVPVVSSRVADACGVTRSVIVSAIRKFESAGAIEARSLGMKGTAIKPVGFSKEELVAAVTTAWEKISWNDSCGAKQAG